MQIETFCELIHKSNINLKVNDRFFFTNEWELSDHIFKATIFSYLENKEVWINVFKIYRTEFGILICPIGVSRSIFQSMFFSTFSKLSIISIGLWQLIIDDEFVSKEMVLEITSGIKYCCLPLKKIEVTRDADFMIPCNNNLTHFILEEPTKTLSSSVVLKRHNAIYRISDWIQYNYDHDVTIDEIPMVFCFPEKKDFESCSQEYRDNLIERYLNDSN